MRTLGVGCLALTLLVTAAGASPQQTADLVFTAFEPTGSVADGLFLAEADGSGVRRLGPSGVCCADWSPDGNELVLSSNGTEQLGRAIYRIRSDGSSSRRLTVVPPEADDVAPQWSRDGSKIAWIRAVNNQNELWLMASDGSTQRRVGLVNTGGVFEWSPTSAEIVWAQAGGGIAGVDVATGAIHQLAPPAASRLTPTQPRWSPDGRRIAFIDNGLEVMNADGGERHVVRSAEGGRGVAVVDAAWAPDGSSIAFTGARLTGEQGRSGPVFRSDVYVIDADGSDERRLTGALDEGFTMKAGDGRFPSFWPDGSRIFFASARASSVGEFMETTYVMNADGSCEQRFAPHGPFLLGPVWRPGAVPRLAPLRCADLRMQAGSDRWGAIGRDASLYVNIENDGNLTAQGLTVVARVQGPARIRPMFAANCRRSAGLACVVAPLAPKERSSLVFALRSAKPGQVAARVSVRSDVPDPDPVAGRTTIRLTFLPCTIVGSVYDDDIVGTPKRDRICSVEGRDRIDGKAGNDYLAGGSAGDVLIGGSGRDVLLGEGGRDIILAVDDERDRVDCGSYRDIAVVDRIDDVAPGCEDLTRAS